jgi:hypothetical protein
MIEREPVGDIRATVVTDDAEPVVTQRGHEPNRVTRHRPLRVGGMVRQLGRVRRLAVTAEIRTDNRMTLHQPRRDRVPGDVRTRMPVQQHYGRSTPSVPHAVFIYELHNAKIARATIYWTQPFEAAESRAPWVERIDA